ncbi:coiled-coil domain-containing protein 180 [Antennarius striatus]|uniref:coiled-coil domain-containing protein 180 n=1 Tax=Antennarius striatus TaxID=241820 RepID=UPI0035B4678F
MCESRAVPSGQVYRQMFDAQVQLSRSLLAGRRDTRTDCLSAEDTNRQGSAASRQQQLDDDDDVDDVIKLPDTMVVDQLSSDVIKRLEEKQRRKHEKTLKQLETELTELTEVCDSQVSSIGLDLISSLQEVDLKLKTLSDRMELPENMEHVSLEEVCGLWDQVEEQMKSKRSRVMKMNHKLTECETERTHKIRAMLRKCCHLLEEIGFLLPSDVHRLIHSEATMLNQSLLANRRGIARLLLLLQEENLKQESLLRLRWEDSLSYWRRGRVDGIVERSRSICSRDDDHQLVTDLLMDPEKKHNLTERRRDIITKISSLVPSTCSSALVSDWFNQLTAVNMQIDGLHADFLHQLRRFYDQRWQQRLAEVECCKEALSDLQLSGEEVNDIVESRLLTLIGQSHKEEEERLAALDLDSDSLSRHAFRLSRCVFALVRGGALLWETHLSHLETKEKEIQQQLLDIRDLQQQTIQRKKGQFDDLLAELRQESSEDALKASLDKAVSFLEDIKDCSVCVSDQYQVLDRLPSLYLEELLSYSSSLSSFHHLNHTYTPSPEELQNLCPSSDQSDPEHSDESEIQKPEIQEAENQELEIQEPEKEEETDRNSTHTSQDWLTEADSSLLQLCDISSDVTFTSARGVAYSGPEFRCPADDLQMETHLILFPVALLTHTLSSWRILFMNHVEQYIHDVLGSTVTMVTDRKEMVRFELELQQKQLTRKHIRKHVYLPRLAELHLHRRRVDAHRQEVLDLLSSCRAELQELQTCISSKNQAFTSVLSNMERVLLTANSSKRILDRMVIVPVCLYRLEAVSTSLQECLDEHIKDTQSCETTFRRTVAARLEDVRSRTTQLLSSFRLFSEGGDFSAQEVKMFQKTLKEETKQVGVTEQSIYADLEELESRSLQEVKETSSGFEEKLSLLTAEMRFTEKVEKVISSTQIQIKAEAACSNQQHSLISSRLEDLKEMIDDTSVHPDQVCLFLSSFNEELRKRCRYLDFLMQESLPVHPDSGNQVRSAPPPVTPQRTRTGMDVTDDSVVDIIKSLNRFCVTRDNDRGRTAAGRSPDQRLPLRNTESALRSIKTDRRFQVFGPEPGENPQSFSSKMNSVLWRTNDSLLRVAEEFYQCERSGIGRLRLVPNGLDLWVENMQQRLLGYQDQGRTFLSMSREEVENQLSVLDEVLSLLPSASIYNYERRQEAELIEEVGGVRLRMEEMLAVSEQQKRENVRQLRASLSSDRLQTLFSGEELRQQQLHGAICSANLDLQECLRVRGEEFVTSLASLTEKLLFQLDDMVRPAETKKVMLQQHSDKGTVTMETQSGQKFRSRTWTGIVYFLPPTDTPADAPPSVTMTTSITTTSCTAAHLAVIEQRDTSAKRFEQLFRSEWLRSHDDQQRQLRDLQTWTTHWKQQIVSVVM